MAGGKTIEPKVDENTLYAVASSTNHTKSIVYVSVEHKKTLGPETEGFS